jgi:hypothetical protein
MTASTYDGTILAVFMAVAGALGPDAHRISEASPEIALAQGEAIDVGAAQAICAGRDSELVLAAADPASGTSLHVALVDHDGNFVPGGSLTIGSANLARSRLHVRCRGDWLLMEMKPGPYAIIAQAGGATRTRFVQVPKDGRLRVTISVPRA